MHTTLCLFSEYQTIDDIIQALNSKEVAGMLLDRYTASYYQARDKLKSLITVTNFEFRRDIGVLFSKDRKDLADCLTFLRLDIVKIVQTITSTYKVSFIYHQVPMIENNFISFLFRWGSTFIIWSNTKAFIEIAFKNTASNASLYPDKRLCYKPEKTLDKNVGRSGIWWNLAS